MIMTYREEDLDHIRWSPGNGEYPRITAIAENRMYQGDKPGNWNVHDDHGWYLHPNRGDMIGGWDFISGALRRMPVGKIVRVTVEVRDEDQEPEDQVRRRVMTDKITV